MTDNANIGWGLFLFTVGLLWATRIQHHGYTALVIVVAMGLGSVARLAPEAGRMWKERREARERPVEPWAPEHPMCRSVFVPVFDEADEVMQVARDLVEANDRSICGDPEGRRVEVLGPSPEPPDDWERENQAAMIEAVKAKRARE